MSEAISGQTDDTHLRIECCDNVLCQSPNNRLIICARTLTTSSGIFRFRDFERPEAEPENKKKHVIHSRNPLAKNEGYAKRCFPDQELKKSTRKRLSTQKVHDIMSYQATEIMEA